MVFERALSWPDWVRGVRMFEGAALLVPAYEMPPGSAGEYFLPMTRLVGWRRGWRVVLRPARDGSLRLEPSPPGGGSTGYGVGECALDLADEETAARALALVRGDRWKERLFAWAVSEARRDGGVARADSNSPP